MKAVIRQWVRGAIVALASMAIYAVALGCYTALMLLVVSMEEGGDNLTVGTTSLTQAVVLLSDRALEPIRSPSPLRHCC